jgi:hypothetical protein
MRARDQRCVVLAAAFPHLGGRPPCRSRLGRKRNERRRRGLVVREYVVRAHRIGRPRCWSRRRRRRRVGGVGGWPGRPSALACLLA